MSDDHGDHDHDHNHDDHGDHDHPHDHETFADPRPRVRAIQSLLVEEGLVSTDSIDEAIHAYETDIGPRNGARVVARAWTDPDYKQRLLADPEAAIGEFDFEVGTQHMRVKENTEDVHNVVVCTLCSCYPWSLLGLPPTWYKTPEYRSRTVREPRSVLAEFGLELDDDVAVDVWDSSSEIRYMVLPRRPEGTEDLSEEELADLVTRDAMIGVERLTAPGAGDGDASATADGGTADPTGAFADLLGVDAEPTFRAPWQARAFGVAVALYDGGTGFDWSAFQRRLIAAVEQTPSGVDDGTGVDAIDDGATDDELIDAAAADDAGSEAERIYYEQWGEALERLLLDHDVLDADRIDDRAAEFAAGERTAAEFVEGDRGH